MAAVVTTTTINRKTVWGDRRVNFVSFAYDTGDYAAGGVAVTAAQLGLNVVDEVIFPGASVDGSSTALVPSFNTATSKIMLFQSTTGAPSILVEKAAGAFVSGTVLRCIAIGY